VCFWKCEVCVSQCVSVSLYTKFQFSWGFLNLFSITVEFVTLLCRNLPEKSPEPMVGYYRRSAYINHSAGLWWRCAAAFLVVIASTAAEQAAASTTKALPKIVISNLRLPVCLSACLSLSGFIHPPLHILFWCISEYLLSIALHFHLSSQSEFYDDENDTKTTMT